VGPGSVMEKRGGERKREGVRPRRGARGEGGTGPGAAVPGGSVRMTRRGERGRGTALAGGLPRVWGPAVERERRGERVTDGVGYSAIGLN
jgi:hypothetical protein